MKHLSEILGAAALAASLAMPAHAQVDAGAMTCGDYAALEGGAKSDAVRAIAIYVNDAANLATTTVASVAIQGKSNEEVQQKIEADCQGQAPETNLISVLK